MTKPALVWGIPGLVYVLFLLWYTPLGGPLTEVEINHYLATMPGNDPERRAGFRAMLMKDTGDPFVMVNVIDIKKHPDPLPGVEPGVTGQQLLDRYMAYMWPELLKRACHPVFYGEALGISLDVWGIEGAERWTTGGLVRYRSLRDLLEIAANPAIQGPHEFKIAAMQKTIAYPVNPLYNPGDPRILLGLLLLLSAMFLHVLLIRR